MARRPVQNNDDVAPGKPDVDGRLLEGEGDRSRRREKVVRVKCTSQSLSVTPREIELLCHYLGAEIDKILHGEK